MMVQKSPDRWLILIIQSYILIGLSVFGVVYATNPSGFMFTAETSFHIMCYLFVALIGWFFVSWYLVTKRLFDPYILFLLSCIIFNGGQIILEVLNLNENGFLNNTFPIAESLQVVYVVTLSLTVMHFGAILAIVLDRPKSDPVQFLEFLDRNSSIAPARGSAIVPATSSAIVPYVGSQIGTTFQSSIVRSSTILAVGQIFLYVSILPVLVTAIGAIQVAKAGGYASLYEQEAATGLAGSAAVIADFIFPGVFLTIAGGKRKPKLRVFAVIYLLFYTVAKLIIGTRGAAVMPLLAMMWLWDSVVKPLPRTLLVVFSALMLLVVFPVIGASRNETAGVDLLSIEFLTKTLTGVNNPLVASLSEMGFSATTIGWTMDLVPKVRPFALGISYLVSVITLIPNVFSAGRHPALTMSGYDIPDFWLVAEIDQDFANRGGSFGFSYIAEAYLNFGWFGLILMAAIGFLFAKFVLWALRDNDPAKMAVIAIFVSFFLFYPRGCSQMVVRPLIWYSLIPYLWMRWLSKLNPTRVKGLVNTLRKGEK
jgi:oligosaccharide repeat unit polymerase